MKDTRNQLKGKIALITGGASGIGLATAARYVNEGAKVVIADLNNDLMKNAKKQFGDACAIIETDVTDESAVENAVTYAVKEFGRLDIGVNSAGLGTYALITDQTEEQFDTVINTCLKGVFFSMKHQGRQMIDQGGGGVIINISSLSSQQPGEGQSAYCAAKAAVNMITSVGAMEMGPHKIRVCGIAPGLVYTPLTEVIKETSALNEAYLENTPLGRAGIPEDISNAALYLASNESSWVSGITLTVDGAAHTKRYPELPKIFAALSDENA